MSYQVLARKYRPKGFDTLVGQEHVVRALSHALDSQRLHHAYLFTGTRGVGKTTLSRILAKAFNCETGITSTPCGHCDACSAIDAGRFVDYIEMDAASNRGVDDMAQLLEQAVYAPSNARFKVYMIDEVHMLSNTAFNSMLKTLEEPPAHVKFILATTDPQKIPVTVLSRCLQFNLKQMPPGHIVSHLDNILGQEGISFETPALRLLAQGAHGSMRDALSLTDQAIAYAAGKVTLEAVQGMLGALDQSFLIRLLDALADQDGAGLLAIADEMAARSLSYNGALQDLGSLLHRIALAQSVPTAIASDVPEREQILRLASRFDAEEVQLYYQIAVHGRNELGLAPDEYAGFSMTLLRMLAFRPELGSVGGAGNAAPAARPTMSAAGALAQAGLATQRAHATAATAATAATNTATAATVAQRPVAAQIASVAQSSVALSPALSPVINAVINSAPNSALNSAPNSATAPAMSPARAALEAARKGARMPAATRGASPVVQPNVQPTVQSTQAPMQPSVQATPIAAEPVSLPYHVELARAVPEALPDLPPAPPWDLGEEIGAAQETSAMPPFMLDQPAAQKKSELIKVPVASTMAPRSSADPQANTRADIQPDLPAAAYVPVAVPAWGWDGHWPALAAILPVKGVAQQLALQSELLRCDLSGAQPLLHLRVAMDTLLSAGSVDKLVVALTQHFGVDLRVSTETGPVRHTANAEALALRAERQQEAEQTLKNDPFVQTMLREFGATVVPGSLRPI